MCTAGPGEGEKPVGRAAAAAEMGVAGAAIAAAATALAALFLASACGEHRALRPDNIDITIEILHRNVAAGGIRRMCMKPPAPRCAEL